MNAIRSFGVLGIGLAIRGGIGLVWVRRRPQPEAWPTTVIPDPIARSASVRAAVALIALLTVACTGPFGQSSAKASPSQPKLSSGGVIEYPVPHPAPYSESTPGNIVMGPDGNLWFVEHIVSLRLGTSRDVVDRMTQSGAITEFEVPGQLGLGGITVGPDGHIWVAAGQGGQVDQGWLLRVSTAGEMTRFQAGRSSPGEVNGAAQGIAPGPDGNIWFTEAPAGRIGRMTPDGKLTEFPIPDNYPSSLAAGPDGNLWFVETTRKAIAKITLAGIVTEYVLSPAQTDLSPNSLVAGSDGNIWFTESGASQDIGRITPKGSVTRFALAPGSQPFSITKGSDGNVWFADWNQTAVGRISPRGIIREFPLPRPGAGPASITAGPNGRIWFTEAFARRIASIGVTVPEVTFGSKVATFSTKSAPNTRTLAITNTGDGALSIASAAIVGPDRDAFTKTRDGCTGHTVAANATCHVDVGFAPGSDGGVMAARLELTDNATASPQAVSLIAQLPSCTLPVFETSRSEPGTHQPPPTPGAVLHGGFLSLASGDLANDPKGGFTSGAQLSSSQATPVLYGQVPASYDRAAGRWVPAPIDVISPDGTRYAYVDYQEMPGLHMHVVDVATGRDRLLALPPGFWAVLDFATEGIYYSSKGYAPAPGLWLLDPDTGTRRQVFGERVVNAVGAGAAWIGTVNAQDPYPPITEGDVPVFDELLRRDLITGASETWFYRPGAGVNLRAVSGGRALIESYEDQGAISWLVSGPNQAERLTVPDSSDAFSYTGGMIADQQGLWLGGAGGIYLWTSRTGPVLVSQVSARPAGACA